MSELDLEAIKKAIAELDAALVPTDHRAMWDAESQQMVSCHCETCRKDAP